MTADERIAIRTRHYLPHRDIQDAVQTVTFQLADAFPVRIQKRLEQMRSRADAKVATAQLLHTALDGGHGECYLHRPEVATVVADTLRHFDEERYRLLAWVVMPSHVHVVVELSPPWTLAKVLHSWKSYTATFANRILGRQGPFWHREYYDRAIRDGKHLRTAIRYVHNNPVKAGLVDRPELWPWSSASQAEAEDPAGMG